MRFRNEEIFKESERVLEQVYEALTNKDAEPSP
jgi:very-short-patch-repair endonuclease